jgi:hypothetical protein
MASIPAALRRVLEDRDRDLLEQPDPDEAIALIVEDMVQVMIDQTGIAAEQRAEPLDKRPARALWVGPMPRLPPAAAALLDHPRPAAAGRAGPL